ncbi:hypothetical protein [Synechocystis sp. PCC 7509]|uniref:hypothetical protein n=1 Tax=Synechocystis sp. PCC 7509 TaxID=927677 RepID=UPI0002ACFB22|nr:hypothetical protein [Synechocystis sp. PCC 7509]
MNEILYIEIPTPETASVSQWLHEEWQPLTGEKVTTPVGVRLQIAKTTSPGSLISETPQLSIFTWSVQRTTYLKVFRMGDRPFPNEQKILQQLTSQVQIKFPQLYPEPPAIDLASCNIFEALAPYYPLTAKYFQKMPNGEADLQRVYWWEQRWREGVRKDQQPKQVVFSHQGQTEQKPEYDLIYVGGALGVIHAAVMAQLGYRVLLLERLPFGRMNREWNISRSELESLIDLGLLTPTETESIIGREYTDGFNKFFDGNNLSHLKSVVLHTPTVLNVWIEYEKLLQLCGEKLKASGGDIWDSTEFMQADVHQSVVTVTIKDLKNFTERKVSGRLLVDAMGTASPIAWQLNGKRAFDSVCPTVGAVVASGFKPGVWDSNYGDVLNSHGDISRGRQLIWELFPGAGEELTIYLFHYHQVNKTNPGSLLEMYEDFFAILPEYRRCDLDKLVWKKPTFGYIPGHFSSDSSDRTVAFDRLIAIGDAASLQSPLVFTGFGSLIRNLGRLTELLDTALQHDLLSAKHLNQIRAYQSNIAVTWLFSKGMMVPTGKYLPPQRINSMLNTFFGLLADEPLEVADNFIKDRFTWFTFNRLALKAAFKNPALLPWIWDLAGAKDIWRWLGNYVNFGIHALISAIFASWFPQLIRRLQPSLEPRFPALWFKLLNISYALTAGLGQPYTNVRKVATTIEKRETELSSQNFNY